MNQEFNKNTIVGIVILFLAFMGYNYYLQTKYPDYYKQQQAQDNATENAAETAVESKAVDPNNSSPANDTAAPTPEASTPSEPQEKINVLADSDLTIDTLNTVYKFNQKTSSIDAITLKDYKESNKSNERKSILQFPVQITAHPSKTYYDNIRPGTNIHLNAERDGDILRFWKYEGSFKITQEYSFDDDGYGGKLQIIYENIAKQAQELNSLLAVRGLFKYMESDGSFIPGVQSERTRYVAKLEGESSAEFVDLQTECESHDPEDLPRFTNREIDVFGVDYHYFLTSFLPFSKNLNLNIKMSHKESLKACDLLILASQEQGLVKPGEKVTLAFKTFIGPKSLETLNAYDENLFATLDLGFFDFIAQPLLKAMLWVNLGIGNYGLTIIVITILLKLLFYPLQKQATISMHKMKKLQPQMNAIKEKYKDDRARQQQELMKFMSINKINPAKGCLPMLPQIPVWFAFFRVLSTAVELRHAPFFGWLADLSAKDPYYISPIILGVVYFIQQKVAPQNVNMDKTQEKIMQFVPVFFAVLMISMPSGLVIYMLANAVITIFQTAWLNRKLD